MASLKIRNLTEEKKTVAKYSVTFDTKVGTIKFVCSLKLPYLYRFLARVFEVATLPLCVNRMITLSIKGNHTIPHRNL